MNLPIDTVYEVACTLYEGRWHATVVEAATPRGGQLLHLKTTDVYDIPFSAVDLIAARRGFRPWRLRLLGPDLPPLFTGGRTASRTRTDDPGEFAESWNALLDGDTVTIAVRSLRIN